jgi:hypothetical protein
MINGERVTAYLVLRGVDVVVTGIVSASGDVEVIGWQRRDGGELGWTPTALERRDAEDGLWEAWGWCWWEDAA